jgi:hypothetical protein
MGNTYTMNGTVVGRPPMMAQQMGQMSLMQQQMMQNAYQMSMGGFGPAMQNMQNIQNMHPTLQQQMAQMQQMQQQAVAAVAAGSMYGGQNGAGMQAVSQGQASMQQFNNFIWSRVDASLPDMAPERVADLVLKAPDQVKRSPQWATSNEHQKARLTLFHLYRQKVMMENARKAQAANGANAAGNTQR